MPQSVSMLLRRVTLNDAATMDSRLVVVGDGRAVLIATPDGHPTAIATALGAEWEAGPDGTVTVTTETGDTWKGQRDTRCGSCGGRYQLRTLDANPFLPTLPEAAPAYGDGY